MKKLILILVILFLFILSLNSVNAISGSINVTVVEDAKVYTSSSNNYGNTHDLKVIDNWKVYLEFIISDIPAGQTITNAQLCGYNYNYHDNLTITSYLVNTTFDENIINGINEPLSSWLYNYNDTKYIVNNTIGYHCFDVTDGVQYAYDIDYTYADFVLSNENFDGITYLGFASKEYIASYPSFYLYVEYSTDYGVYCQYNSFKDAVITTCSNFYSSYYCNCLFDECSGYAQGCTFPEWITQSNVVYDIPPYKPTLVAELERAVYFDKVEVWIRGVNHTGQPTQFKIDVYSPETEIWYTMITEADFVGRDDLISGKEFDGSIGGQTVGHYLHDAGGLPISKVQIAVFDVVGSPTNLIFPEVAFCMRGESEPVYSNVTYNVSEVGAPCETDADCECRLCEYGFCVLKRARMDCIIDNVSRDDCCLSGECSNGKCTKEGMWAGILASKNQQFGDDADTNNFISLFFIIAIAGFLMYYGNIIAGVFTLYLLSIFFVIVGWLSPFILLGMIITGLIAIVFKVMIGHGTE